MSAPDDECCDKELGDHRTQLLTSRASLWRSHLNGVLNDE